MSLNRSERNSTGEELRRHLDASGLTPQELATWLGLPVADVEGALSMSNADPVVVWQVRDALDQAVREGGGMSGGWSVLTDTARLKAQQWFALRPVPPRR